MKIWISGAGGMMASHLAEMLLEAGHEVLATYYKPTIDPQDLQAFSAVEVDITDWCSVFDSMNAFQPEAVFHLAAQSYPTISWMRPVETLTTNVIGTANVFEAIRRVNAKAKIVVAGSSAEYGVVADDEIPVKESHKLQPLHPYGVSKVATDLLAHQYHASYGIDAVTARIFNCTGPRKTGDAVSDFVRRSVWLERKAESAGTIKVGNLTTMRTIVDVRDLNRALILLMDKGCGGEVYNLGGSTVYTMQAILDQVLAESTRRDIAAEIDPALIRPNDEKIIYGDCSRLVSETGWAQRISLQQTIKDMYTYWRSKPDLALKI